MSSVLSVRKSKSFTTVLGAFPNDSVRRPAIHQGPYRTLDYGFSEWHRTEIGALVFLYMMAMELDVSNENPVPDDLRIERVGDDKALREWLSFFTLFEWELYT